jgi:capsular polysaccharide biosynthesis protein
MTGPVNGVSYLKHLRRRWRVPAAAVLAAGAAALALSLVWPKRYTARVALLIEPPARGDPRAPLVISSIYLESLRTYEHLAASDQLFEEAARRFRLRQGGREPIERLKDRVLRVSIPRNTRVLEIEVTLGDPKLAHEVALFLARNVMARTRKAGLPERDESLTLARRRAEEAWQRVESAVAAFREALRHSRTADPLRAQTEVEAARADLESARVSAELAESQLRELALAGSYGERLELLDPGVVPERPSSPNLPLNVVVACSLALLFSLGYLTLAYGLAQPQSAEASVVPWVRAGP